MNTKFYYFTTLLLAFSTLSYADTNSEILNHIDKSDRKITKQEDSSLEESDIYNKSKAHFWTKPFMSNYYVRNDAKQTLDYSFNNYGSIFALDFKPTDESLVGVAFTGGMGNVTIKKVNDVILKNSVLDLSMKGLSVFGGFRTPLGLRVDAVFSGFNINASTQDDTLKSILAYQSITANVINLTSFESKVKCILDFVPNKHVSFHPYVGISYGTMTSTELSAANSGNDNLYDTKSLMFGIDVWGYYKFNTTKLYPNLYANYEILMNPKKSDPTSITSNFNFGNKFNVGGSFYFEFTDIIDLELGYNFELNDKLKGNNYFLKLKFDL